MAQLQKGSTPLTQLHGPAIGCLQLGGIKSLENGRMGGLYGCDSKPEDMIIP